MAAPDTLFASLLPPHPLGEGYRSSLRAANDQSGSRHAGATNLLHKAARALASGDDDRALSLIGRAAGIPWDAFEEEIPAAGSAHMMLFCLVADAVEDSDEDDTAWLAAVLATLDEVDGSGRADLQHCLAVIAHDYRLPSAVRVLVERTISDTDPDTIRLDDLPDGSPELLDRLHASLRAYNSYERALGDLRSA